LLGFYSAGFRKSHKLSHFTPGKSAFTPLVSRDFQLGLFQITIMQKITPFLWFNGNAEEAARFYSSVFSDAQLGKIVRMGAETTGTEGPVLTATFSLFGQQFIALNGGPQYSFTPAISFVVNCDTQEEIDELWQKLSEGGTIQQCGWLQDRFGLSWQIVPSQLGTWMQHSEPTARARMFAALMGMQKLDMRVLQQALEGNAPVPAAL
jgi:predicted 3-demethylubiquinone-9 3-methyltransferase (glyoxalase superfamily)